MGSSSSKFRRYLQNGDEYAALQTFKNSTELQHNLDPNSSYGDSLKNNTPLHLVALHAMKPLLRIFLTELKGNPNKQNSLGETPLHLVCQGDITRNLANQERRAICLQLILQWRKSPDSEEKVQLDCLDDEGKTPLQYAAASGLKNCVEILVTQGASLFVENKSSETACDLAEKNKHVDIAQYLETKMLLYSDTSESVPPSSEDVSNDEEVHGLTAQDLQEAKDLLLIETSEMFYIPLFTAEVLLRKYEWSRQTLLDAWMKDPIACCTEAGIAPPSSAVKYSPTQDTLKKCCEQIQNEYHNETLNSPSKSVVVKEDILCDICILNISADDTVHMPCTHLFCKECWKGYLTDKIKEGDAHNILCPAINCSFVIPVDVIEKLVSADMVERYLQFDIKAFVESNPTIKWCPYPGCGRAVKIPEIEKVNDESLAIAFTTLPALSHSVDCGNGHYFCWECSGEAHAPCGCKKWREWYSKIAEIKPEELKNTNSESEEAENSLWMVINSKQCPNCKRPIQRIDGCNQMRCLKCRHDFCWACLEPWKKHNISTGGHFQCNRFEDLKRVEVNNEALLNQAENRNKQMQELKKFLLYFARFKKQENCYLFEKKYVKSIEEKINILTTNTFSDSACNIDLSSLKEAIYELLRARRILCGTYVYGFYLEDNGIDTTIFEMLQTELEESTGKLSEAIICSYIQTPLSKIMQLFASVKRNRMDILNAVHKGLIPPETPPSLRKKRRHRLPGFIGLDPDDDPMISQAILDSLESIDPNDPWVINQHGKHINVAAVCDWPDYDSDGEEGPSNPILTSVLGVCSRDGCNRPRAKSKRTGEIYEFCSLSCKHGRDLKGSDTNKVTAVIDPVIENLIALQLSKLQLPGAISDDLPSVVSRNEVHPVETNLSSVNDNKAPKENTEYQKRKLSLDSSDAQNVEEVEDESDNISEEICDTPSFSLVADSEEFSHICNNGSQENSLNFYLKKLG